jgi:hypothetical protein
MKLGRAAPHNEGARQQRAACRLSINATSSASSPDNVSKTLLFTLVSAVRAATAPDHHLFALL